MSSVISNKRIVKNSLLLYFRMFFLMAISLYTVRVVLNQLGVTDYGIYNVVGSVVGMCSFLTSSLTAASNRFYGIEYVKPGRGNLNKVLCLNITVFISLFLLLVLILETAGVWYLETKMIIPSDRMIAARWVFQFSVLSLGLSFIQVPYVALIMIHERMSAYAYISIVDGVLKLIVAISLSYSSGDKLILFSSLTFISFIINTFCYYIYCRRKFIESRYRFFWDKLLFVQIFKFSGWYLLGSTSAVIKSYGINLLINAFFNPAVNAARGIAAQVESAVLRLSDGFFSATRPQLYKAYSIGEYENLYRLICRTTIISVFLMSFLMFPLIFNAHWVLSLWLGGVPQFTVSFLELTLIDSVLNSSSSSIITTILATGEQKNYQILEFIFRVMALPIGYVVLYWGGSPQSTALVCVICSVCSVFMRAIMLHKVFGYFILRNYIQLLIRITVVNIVVFIMIKCCMYSISSGLGYFLLSGSLSVILLVVGYALFILSKNDRNAVLSVVKSKILK